MTREGFEPAAQHVEHLHRRGALLHAIEAQLQIREPGFVQLLDELLGQTVAVGDHLPAAKAELSHPRDDLHEARVKRRLAARQADDPGTEIPQLLEAPFELGVRNRPRRLVVLEAVLAGEVAAAGDDQLREKRTIGEPLATG